MVGSGGQGGPADMYANDFKHVISKHKISIKFMGTFYEIAPRCKHLRW